MFAYSRHPLEIKETVKLGNKLGKNRIDSRQKKRKNDGGQKPVILTLYVFPIVFSKFLQFFMIPYFFSNISYFSLATSIFPIFLERSKIAKTSRKVGKIREDIGSIKELIAFGISS
jgi:hypothetical protein